MVRNVVAECKQWANLQSFFNSCYTHTQKQKKTNCVFCIPACDGPAACKRRENPEGEHRSFLHNLMYQCIIWQSMGRVLPANRCVFPPRLRRQFCRERLPPERDGGMREVQRDGSQAEEHAGSSQAFFSAWYFPTWYFPPYFFSLTTKSARTDAARFD